MKGFRKHLASRWLPLPFVGPLWLVLGGLVLLPLVGVLALSFATMDRETARVVPDGPVEGLDYAFSGHALESHGQAVEASNLRVAWRSMWMACATTVLTALVGYPLAYFIAVTASPRWRQLLLLLAVVPFWTSFLVRTFAWMEILRPQGLLNQSIIWLGLIHEPMDLLYNNWAVLLGLVYGELPFMVLPVYASLERLDRSLLEASRDLGAGVGSTFFRVTLPLSLPGLLAGAVLVFVPSVGQYVVSDLLGGAKSVLLGNLIHTYYSGGNAPVGAAIAIQMTAGVLLMAWFYARYTRRLGLESQLHG